VQGLKFVEGGKFESYFCFDINLNEVNGAVS
jgi:hypothetical protein